MKISILYTLSQFVDLIVLKYGWQYKTKSNGLDLIKKYNDFLKLELKKEMFVCDVDEPKQPKEDDLLGIISATYYQQLGKFREAQNKVIFDGEQMKTWGFEIDSIINRYKTIYDLAEATNGELKLKNIEL